MMDPFEPNNIDAAVRIYCTCDELKYPESHAKLFVYIHFKINEYGILSLLNGKQEISAIRILLGLDEIMAPFGNREKDSLQKLSNTIKDADRKNTMHTGKEFVMGSELYNRLRFHEDVSYREEMLNLYYSFILPEINPRFKELTA